MKCFKCGAFFKHTNDNQGCFCQHCLDEEPTQNDLHLSEEAIRDEIQLTRLDHGCGKTLPVFYD